MKIFVIGFSQSGKSTLAKALSETFDAVHISASNWTKQFEINKSDLEYRAKVTNASREALSKDHLISVQAIRTEVLESKKAIKIIEGIRNPFDFTHLFDIKNDYVIFLFPCDVVASDSFDGGVKVIQDTALWMLANNMIQIERIFIERNHTVEETKKLAAYFFCGNRQLFRKCN